MREKEICAEILTAFTTYSSHLRLNISLTCVSYHFKFYNHIKIANSLR